MEEGKNRRKALENFIKNFLNEFLIFLKSSSIEANRATFWQDPTSPLSLNDCKNLVRFVKDLFKIFNFFKKDLLFNQ